MKVEQKDAIQRPEGKNKPCWVCLWADLWAAVWRGQQRSEEYEIRPLEEKDFMPV